MIFRNPYHTCNFNIDYNVLWRNVQGHGNYRDETLIEGKSNKKGTKKKGKIK